MSAMLKATALPQAQDADDGALGARPGLAALVARGGAAFELLMRRYNQRLFRLARSMLRNTAEAEDALQDAYLSAYQAIGSWRGEASVATWLSRVVSNQCLGRLRRQARRDNIVPMVSMTGADDEEHEPMPTQESETPDRSLVRAELRALLERKLDELPEAFRTVFVLRSVEELSVEETAQSLSIPEATVRSRHFRARSLLRESLAQDIDVAERDVFSFDGERCDRIVAGVLARMPGP